MRSNGCFAATQPGRPSRQPGSLRDRKASHRRTQPDAGRYRARARTEPLPSLLEALASLYPEPAVEELARLAEAVVADEEAAPAMPEALAGGVRASESTSEPVTAPAMPALQDER